MVGRVFSADTVTDWVRASCHAQGVPLLVHDTVVLATVAVLLTGRAGPPVGGASAPPRRARRAVSEAPHGSDPVRVDAAGSGGAGTDHRMIQHGGDDLGLAG